MLRLKIELLDLSSETSEPWHRLILESSNAFYSLTPEVIYDKLPDVSRDIRLGFNAHVLGEQTGLTISGFEYFTLAKFSNTNATFPLLRVRGASQFFRFNDLTIIRLDVDNSNSLIVNCNVSEFNVGIETDYERARQKEEAGAPVPVSTDIRHSTVQRLRLFVPQSTVTLQGCDVNVVKMEQHVARVDTLRISEATDVHYLSTTGHVRALDVEEGFVDTLAIAKGATIGEFRVRAGRVAECYGALTATFPLPTLETANLVISSAKNARDADLLADASYSYAHLLRGTYNSRFGKAVAWGMDVTCGFGYKPQKTVITAFLAWLAFALMYFLLTVFGSGGIRLPEAANSPVHILGYSLYFSAITLTTVGFGDVRPLGSMAMALAAAEGALGIILFALLVFSLSRRYGS